MPLFGDPIDALSGLQQALDSFRSSGWLASGPSGGGSYPPMNVFRKGDDFIIITEVPGIKKSDLQVQVKGNTIRLSGSKSVTYPDKAGVHRRERLSGRFDRAMTWLVSIPGEKDLSSRLYRKIDEAVTSVILNIAEGNGRYSELDHRRFLDIAESSAVKVAAFLDLAVRKLMLAEQECGPAKALLERIVAMLSRM